MIVTAKVTCDDCGKKFTIEYNDDETIEDGMWLNSCSIYGMWLNSCSICGLVLCLHCFNKHTLGKCMQEETDEN